MIRDEVEDLLHADESDGDVWPEEDIDHFGRRVSWDGIEDALYATDPLAESDFPLDLSA